MEQERFCYRAIKIEEATVAAQMEQACFPPEEAWPAALMMERIKKLPNMTIVVEDMVTMQLVGMINGIATDDETFRDEFITDISLHNPTGKNIMITGLQILPAYRHRGLAKSLMSHYLAQEKSRGRHNVFLTCLADKIPMYQKMGFHPTGNLSTWATLPYHEMHRPL